MRSLHAAILGLTLAWGSVAVADDKGTRRERSEAQGELGRAYLQEGSLESAIRTLQIAVELDGRNWKARSLLGLALAEKGKVEEAEKQLARAVRLAPERAEAHVNYGLFLQGRGQLDEAIAQYELAMDDVTYRNPAVVLNDLGFALLLRGEAQRAAEVLAEAVRRAPNLCQPRFNLGLAQENLGQVREALTTFKDILTVCGDDVPGAYLAAGRLLASQGEEGEATAMLLKVSELVPGTDAADEADRLLKEMGP
ncbi:MAG: tetratricopeptide repeat protein [Pseudomonadota bacterium]